MHVPTGSQQGPLDSASLENAAAGDLLLRLSLAALVAQEYDAAGHPDTSLHHFRSQKAKYLETAIWWGGQLAGMSQGTFESTYNDGAGDLYRANMILSLAVAYDWLWPYMDAIERHDWLAGLFEKTHDFYLDAGHDASLSDYPAVHLQGNDGLHYAAHSTNKMRKLILNGHTVASYDAVGVAYLAMEVEMCGWASCSTGLPFDMYEDARVAFDDAEAELGDDGANHNGVFYGLDYLGRLLEFREAGYSRGGLPWGRSSASSSGARKLAPMDRS